MYKEGSQVLISSTKYFLFLPSGPKECCLVFPISQRSKKEVEDLLEIMTKPPWNSIRLAFFQLPSCKLLTVQILLVKNTVERSRMEKQRF